MVLNVSALFKKMNLRVADTVLERVRNGSKYKLIKKESLNGRGLGEHLEILDGINSDEAIIEFLQNYLREGRLVKDTKKKLQLYIRNLKKSINENVENKPTQEVNIQNKAIQERINLDNKEVYSENQFYGGVKMIYSTENKYMYRSNSYEINEIIDFVVKARIEKISPFTLLNELNYPAGTVHTWYKDLNELRILYSLYSMDNDEKLEKFDGYSKEEVIEFNKDIYDLVMSSENITEQLKNKYLTNIDDFNEFLNNLTSEIEKENSNENKNINIDIIKVITQTEEIWKAFANSNKEKIFEILYNDEEILSMVLKKIYM